MKSLLSLSLIACLVASAVPVTAQGQSETPTPFDIRSLPSQATAGPLARAVMREADRLAVAGALIPSSSDAVQQGEGPPAESNWSRVRTLAPGTEIIVTVKGSTPARRYFIAADESGFTMLNLAAVGLQFTAARVLRDMASRHPEDLQAAQNLGQVVENIARTDVAEIHALPKPFWNSVHRHAKIGLGVGAVVGLVAGLASRRDECGSGCVPAFVFGGSLMGAEIGAMNGAVLGAITRMTQRVIYRAP